jgi:uncharacterized protein YueI
MIVKKIYSDIYTTEFIFIISKAKKINRKEIKIKWNKYAGCCKYKDKIYIVVNPCASTDALVHECDHAVSKLWKMLNIKKKRGIDECYSYMLSWLFKKCLKIWKKNS